MNFKALLNDFWNDGAQSLRNAYNQAAYSFIGGLPAQYDYKNQTYLDKGYKTNPDVFAVMDQRVRKVRSIPFYIKKVEDQQARKKIKQILEATKGDTTIIQKANIAKLESKAYAEEDLKLPLEKPNPNQNWSDLFALHELYFGLIGNSYWLKISPTDGLNAGVPTMVYVLPAHKIKLVLKKDADLLYDENPIEYYQLTDGDQKIYFKSEDIIHIKTANPDFDLNGSHLYGMSPMMALLRNIESSNEAINNNIKMMKNAGAFGIITGKDMVLQPEQATQIKERLYDMDRDTGRLSRMAAVSVPIEYTQISMSTKDLMPFDYLKFDQKTICNVLGWYDVLLNNSDSSTYNNVKTFQKLAIVNTIQPNLMILSEALDAGLWPKFKGYENTVSYFDISELPEMQEDYKEMIEWMQKAYLTPNEIRNAVKYESSDIDGMDVPRIPGGSKRIDEIEFSATDIQKAYQNEL
jgi:HK97 family phage portal protein